MQLELAHPTDTRKVVKAKSDASGALIVSLSSEAPSTTSTPTEPYNQTLTEGITVTNTDMQSLALVNDESSTGNITIASAGSIVVLKPGEVVSWEATSGSTLTAVTITLPAGTTGRMFGTRAAIV